MNPLVSVVIPVLAGADEVEHLVGEIASESGVEVIVVDGGPDPRLDPLDGRPGVRVLRAQGVFPVPRRGLRFNLPTRRDLPRRRREFFITSGRERPPGRFWRAVEDDNLTRSPSAKVEVLTRQGA
jgi:hypothetical protein